MKKLIMKDGTTMNYELVQTHKAGSCNIALFKVIQEDAASWWIAACRSADKDGNPTLADENGEPNSHVIAYSTEEHDAIMVHASISLSHIIASNEKISRLFSKADETIIKEREVLEKHLRAAGYDIDACIAKLDELSKAGKSDKEIMDYMMEHRTDFIIKDKPDTKGGSVKNEEVW